MNNRCNSYCSHGGHCILELNHESNHYNVYCEWTDEEALSKEKADEIFRLESAYNGMPNLAELIIFLEDFLG